MCRSGRGDPLGALDRGRGEGRDAQAAVGGEGLLRREVVDVGLGEVDRQAAGARGGVDEDQRAVVGAGGPLHRAPSPRWRSRCAPRRRRRRRPRPPRTGREPGSLADHRRLVEPGRRLDRGGELAENSPKDRCWLLLLDQPERRDVPERRGAAVAEHDLVAVGQREQLGQPLADPADDVADRRLPVRRAHQATRRWPRARRGARAGSWRDRPRTGRRRAAGRTGSHALVGASVTPPILAAAHLDTRRSPDAPEGAPRATRRGCGACSLLGGVLRRAGRARHRRVGAGGRRLGSGGRAGPGASSRSACLVVSRDDGARPVVPGVRGPQPGGRRDLRELRARPWLISPMRSRSSASATATPTRCC